MAPVLCCCIEDSLSVGKAHAENRLFSFTCDVTGSFAAAPGNGEAVTEARFAHIFHLYASELLPF